MGLPRCGEMPDDGVVRVEADKPAERLIVAELFDRHPLRADAVNRLLEPGQQ